jgi:hypothetical protein
MRKGMGDGGYSTRFTLSVQYKRDSLRLQAAYWIAAKFAFKEPQRNQ